MGTLRFVTLTGAGEKTSFARMARLSGGNALVEWGVLFSRDRAGTENKYPSLEWLERFARKANARGMNIALHLCGRVVKDLLKQALSPEPPSEELQRILNLAELFGRVQLNTRAKVEDEHAFTVLIGKLTRNENHTRVIVQWNSHNEDLCKRLRWVEAFESLVDDSGGRGVERTSWPELAFNETRRPGFAGGLGPDNVAGQLIAINGAAGDRSFWIDAEGKLRDKADQLDLGLCEQMVSKATEFWESERARAGALNGKGTRKVATLAGFWLDWWVAAVTQQHTRLVIPPKDAVAVMLLNRHEGTFEQFDPRQDAVELFSQQQIALCPQKDRSWRAYAIESAHSNAQRTCSGKSLEIAGLRAIVAGRYGPVVPKNPLLKLENL